MQSPPPATESAGRILRRRRFSAFVLVGAAAVLGAGRGAWGATSMPTPVWSSQTRLPGAGSLVVPPSAQRLLADGSWMIALRTESGIAAFRYDTAGNLLSSVRVPLNSFKALAIDPFGGLFAFSSSSLNGTEFWLMKYDGFSGHALWSAPATFHNPGSTFHDAVALAVDGSGDVVAIGDVGTTGNADWATLKFDGRSGALLWGPRILDGPAHANDLPVALAFDSSGDIFVTGTSIASGFNADITTLKYTGATGALLWGPVSFDGPTHSYDSPVAIAVDAGGDMVVSGNSFKGLASTSDFVTLKYDGTTGATVWGPAFFDGASHGQDDVAAIALGPTGNVFVTGASYTGANPDWATLEYDGSTGARVWGPSVFQGTGNPLDLPTSLTVDSAGDLYVGGQSGTDYATLKYDGSTGVLAWGPNVFGLTLDNFLPGVVLIDPSGDVIAAMSPNGAAAILAVVKYSGTNGATVWGPVLQPNDEGQDTALAGMTTDAAGNVLITGIDSAGTKSATWKLAAATGAPLWGPIMLSNARALASTTDGNGDLLVVFDRLVGSDVQALTVKYQGTTGAVLWGPVVLTLPGTGYEPLAVGVDAANDVVVSGAFTQNSTTNVFAAKYGGSSGVLLWGPALAGSFPAYGLPAFFQRIDGSGNIVLFTDGFQSIDPRITDSFLTVKFSGSTGVVLWGPLKFISDTYAFPSSLELDSAGNAFVAGHAFHGGHIDFVLLKYASANGALLWGPIYNQDTNSLVRPLLAVDASGDVFESGYSDYPEYEIVTLKYSGATGSPLWGPIVYTGSPGSFPSSDAVAVDPGNHVVVAGRATGVDDDYLLLGYSGADGSPLWEPVQTDSGGIEHLEILRLVGSDPVVSGVQGFGTLLTIRYGLGLAVQTPAGELPPAFCGQPYSAALTAVNGSLPYSWTIVAGGLPPGITLAPSGAITGTTQAEGTYIFRARVTDMTAAFAEADFTLTVGDAGHFVPILASATSICPGQSVTLSVAGSYASYHWLPGGQTSPTITVNPADSTDYGVVLTDATGCLVKGSIHIAVGARVVAIQRPACVAAGGTGYSASVPDEGAGASYAWSIVNGSITSGAGTSAITFSASEPGAVLLNVEAVDGSGCAASGETSASQCSEGFYSVAPCRVVDTRNPLGPTGGPALSAQANRSFTLAGHCGIPSNARGVSANLTITQPTAAGDLRTYPGGGTLPPTSVINYLPGQTRANNAILSLGPDGDVVVHCDQAAGSVHFIIDVNGYFQ